MSASVTMSACCSGAGLGPCAVRTLAQLLRAGGTPALYTYLYAHPSLSGLTAGGTFASHASVRGKPNWDSSFRGKLLQQEAVWTGDSFRVRVVGSAAGPGGERAREEDLGLLVLLRHLAQGGSEPDERHAHQVARVHRGKSSYHHDCAEQSWE